MQAIPQIPPTLRRSRPAAPAFTRVDLVTVLAAIALLASLFVAARAREAAADSRSVCLLRLHRLAQAMTLFAADNLEWLPPNPDDGNTTPGYNWCPGQAGLDGPEQFNPDILNDPSRALLAPYLDGQVWVYRCPEDRRTGRYLGTNVLYRGSMIPSARTVALSQAVGTDPYRGGRVAVDAEWLDGSNGHTANKTWYCFAKMGDFIRPGPARTFTFIEENGFSVNDAGFGTVGPRTPPNDLMIDWPATYHGMAAAVAFADGHAEMHVWQDPRTVLEVPHPGTVYQSGSVDVRWIAEHATALIAAPQE